MAKVAFYTALVVWLTWPLGANLATHEPFRNNPHLDFQLVAWSLASQSLALVHDPSALPHPAVYHPTPWALYYGETAFGALPFFIGPFIATDDATLAMNLTFVAGIVFTAWSLHTVATRWTGSPLAGFLAAWTFLTTPWVLWRWGPVAPNYALLPYFPWIIYLAAARPLTRGKAVALTTLIVLQSLVSVYIAVAVLAPLAILAPLRFARRATRSDGLRLALVLLAGLVPLAIIEYPHALVRLANADLPLQSLYAGYALKTVSRPGDLVDPNVPARLTGTTVALIVLGLAAALRRARRLGESGRVAPWRNAIFWSVSGLMLSMKPVFVWGQGHRLVLPHAVIEALHLPLYEAVRAPNRLGVAALMGMALASALAFAEIFGVRDGRPWPGRLRGIAAVTRLAVCGALIIALYTGYRTQASTAELPWLLGNYPITPRPDVVRGDSPIADRLRETGGALLELPIGSRKYPQLDHLLPMLRALDHGRPILNGYHGYWPAAFPARMALACRLPDAESLAKLRRETGLEYVLVDLDRVGERAKAPSPYRCPPIPGGTATAPGVSQDREAWLSVVTTPRTDLVLVAAEGRRLLFHVPGAPHERSSIDAQ